MIIIATCPICYQQLELPFSFSDENMDTESNEYITIKIIPCNHLYKYSDETFIQHSFIIKVDRDGKIYPTPFFGEKISKSRPVLYNSYLRPVVSLRELYNRIEALTSELSFFKERSILLQAELDLTNSFGDSHENNDIINLDEIQSIVKLDKLESDNELLQNDYVSLALNNRDWYMELEDLRKKVKDSENPNEELKIVFQLLQERFRQLKDDYNNLELKNEVLYQQLIEAQINSIIPKATKIDYPVFHPFEHHTTDLVEQMLHNELLIMTQQKNVYETEITRISKLLDDNEHQLNFLKQQDVSKSELQSQNIFLNDKMRDFGNKLEELIKNVENNKISDVISNYYKLLHSRIKYLEDLYLDVVREITDNVSGQRRLLKLPEIDENHPGLLLPKTELATLEKKIINLIQEKDRPSNLGNKKDLRPDPNIFYKKVTDDEWKYSKDDQLIFMKALFRLDSFMMDAAKELTLDGQLKEFMKFFKNLKDRANKVIKALNNLVTKNEEAFNRVPDFMQEYLLQYVGKISEIELDKEIFTEKELTLLSYSFMLGEIPLMEENKISRSETNAIIPKNTSNQKKKEKKSTKKTKTALPASSKTINLVELEIDDLL